MFLLIAGSEFDNKEQEVDSCIEEIKSILSRQKIEDVVIKEVLENVSKIKEIYMEKFVQVRIL